MRAVIIDSGGVILRTITSPPEAFAQQAISGEIILALTTDDYGFIDDANIIVSEDGTFATSPDAPPGTSLPTSDLELVA